MFRKQVGPPGLQVGTVALLQKLVLCAMHDAGLISRFWEKVNKTDTCWEWIGALNGKGYGHIRVTKQRKMILAHRLSYEMHKEAIPVGLVLDHLCRNTKCCNPDHLEAVTQCVNNMRGTSVAVHNKNKHNCRCGREYDLVIDQRRRCSACMKMRSAEQRDAYRASPRQPKPTREELKALLDEGKGYMELARMFGYSDAAVHKWAKKFGLHK